MVTIVSQHSESGRRPYRWLLGCLWGAALLVSGACSKAPPPVSAVAPAPEAVVPAPAAATATQAQADEAKLETLAKAYHNIRCVLVGSRFPPESLYEANGFASASAFSQSFQKAASANLGWASKAIADSYATDCKGKP